MQNIAANILFKNRKGTIFSFAKSAFNTIKLMFINPPK